MSKAEYIEGKPWKPGQVKRRGTLDTFMWTDKDGNHQVRYLKRQKIRPINKAPRRKGNAA